MTVVDTTTGEVVAVLDETSARRLADRIGAHVARLNVHLGELVEMIHAAYTGRAWVTLGHGSWEDLCEAEGWELRPRTGTERAALAYAFRDKGMSFRAIGKVMGTSDATVRRDVGDAGASFDAPDGPTSEPPTVIGLDGKAYPASRPAPAPAPAPEPTDDDDDEPVDAEIVEDFLASDEAYAAEMSLRNYRQAFMRRVEALAIRATDPERIADATLLDDENVVELDQLVESLHATVAEFHSRYRIARRERSGLRAIPGGRQ